MTTDIPYWPDDPMIDRKAHRLIISRDTAECTCGEFSQIGLWDHHSVFDAYDEHMYDVQIRARQNGGQR